MRVSSNQYHLTTIRNIQQSTAEYSKLSTQLATNQRIQKPSDDPLGAVMLLTLNSELTKLDQYKSNMNAVHFNLGQQETQLSSIVNTLSSVQEIVTTAADGSMGQAELEAFSQELAVLMPAIVDLLNAKDGNGNYYFSGSLTDVKPLSAMHWAYISTTATTVCVRLRCQITPVCRAILWAARWTQA